MGQPYRSWAERREIIKAVIADSNPKPISEFQLTESESLYYRARSAQAVENLAKKSSTFKAYYRLPTARPFGLVVGIAAVTSAGAAFVATWLIWHPHKEGLPYPVLAACGTVVVAALGWVVGGWITHRNTVRQNTNNILFSRFSQAPFGEALHRFHNHFGWSVAEQITSQMLKDLRTSKCEADQRAASAATYILNYLESVASGVINGDLDQRIVTDNIRGVVIGYHDKCASHIGTANMANPKTFANLIKLRTHYREP